MNLTTAKSKIATLLGTTSLLTTLGALTAHAQDVAQDQAQMQPGAGQGLPENVLVTGSLIRGTVAVGVPVTNLSPMDFSTTGAVKIGDLFKDIPQANTFEAGAGSNSGGHLERETRVNLRGLDQTGPRSLMMIDGMRFPPQADGICSIDPSIIPAIALDHIDVLADGASATYGSDAIAGVINVILKRNYDGAETQLGFSRSDSGKMHWLASQLWGRTWDGGQITLSYEWYDDGTTMGSKHSNYTVDYRPWGLVDQRTIGSSVPGTLAVNGPSLPPNTVGAANCTNCYAVPAGSGANFPGGIGPTAPSSGPNLINWGTLSTPANIYSNGGQVNVFDPLSISTFDPPQQRNAAVMTVDQRLTKDISFTGEAFYSNRRAEALSPGTQNPTASLAMNAVPIPSWNPYYPTNVPNLGNTDKNGNPCAVLGVNGCKANTLNVSYNIGLEKPGIANASELAERYAMGLNIALPHGWEGNIYYSYSKDQNELETKSINKNAISAALGWTIQPVAPAGTAPAYGTWTKPASVPYLNLLCDATQFQCNSDSTLAYVQGVRNFDESMLDNEKGIKFDGPLFDLPGGTVKMAVGASLVGANFHFIRSDNSTTPNLVISPQIDAEPYSVWAVFTQLNVPIIGDNNSLPLVRKLDFEASWRHDQYSGTLSGATSNPKVAITWLLSEDAGLSLRGSWGTSFRFANAGEYSTIASSAFGAFNLPAGLAPSAPLITIACNSATHAPDPGSAAAKMFIAGDPVFGCNGTPVGGLSEGGGPLALLRPATRLTESGLLKPELATNWSAGVQFTPTAFLPGLDLQATWYQVKINGVLTAFNQFGQSNFNSGSEGFHIVVPSDMQGCTVAMNANPTACAPFENIVSGLLTTTGNVADPSVRTLIYWINDGGTIGLGYRKVDGVDWSASYDWDLGNIGAFNVGQTGTYYLQDATSNGPGTPLVDLFHSTINTIGTVQQNGVPTLPRMHTRSRIGWSNGPWTITSFMNYTSHWYDKSTPAPPNVNNQCLPDGTSAGGTSACKINAYDSHLPPMYTFDLSFGYDTGDMPANTYLQHIGVNFVIQNIMNKHAAFEYGFSSQARGFTAFDRLATDDGRIFNIVVTKTW